MSDVFSKAVRSKVMSRIRAKNTKPEKIVRSFLFSAGFRYRIHQKTLPGRPDLVLKKYGAVVFVNGCFWHGHKDCKHFNMPKTRQEYWIPKIQGNIAKDAKVVKKLQALGWSVFTIWECELKGAVTLQTLVTLAVNIKRNGGQRT
jgi:DNA mismatch endonuclease, patch repair protein